MSCHIFCAHSDRSVICRLETALKGIAEDLLCINVFDDSRSMLSAADEIWKAGGDVAMVFCGLTITGTDGEHVFRTMKKDSMFRGIRKILLDPPDDIEAIDELLQKGVMQARLDPEFEVEKLAKLLKQQLTDYVVNFAPHLIDDVYLLLDLPLLAGGLSAARKNFELLSSRMSKVHRSVIGDPLFSDANVEEEMIKEFDRILKNPERRRFEPGEDLLREGDEAGRIWITLSGRIKLIRMIEGEELIFHSASAGKIVGLMSLFLQKPVFFTCRAVTGVEAMALTRDQVRGAIQKSPVLAQYLITVIMRTMARRNGRAAELFMEVRTLNIELSRQRDELATALKELHTAQDRLVDSAKMATLGNLAAGMAHELNNPVGAILRSAEHLGDDLVSFLNGVPELEAAAGAVSLARLAPPLSTREERALRKELARELQIDSEDAGRLVSVGARSKKEVEELLKSTRRKLKQMGEEEKRKLIGEISGAGKIGSSLRNIENCSVRISELVRSLKVYARNENTLTPGVSVNQTIDDVLLILANKVREVSLHKGYRLLPTIKANPSQLQQVWTNLISNSLKALEGKGMLRIRSFVLREGWIRVEIEDNGPGIPDEIREKLWEAHFTTRAGRVEFGLGMGLPIVGTIIRQHGGEIGFESKPGKTVFTVDLPVDQKTDAET